MSNSRTIPAGSKPAMRASWTPRHRPGRGRHREPARTAAGLVTVSGRAGMKILATGVLGSAAIMVMQAGTAPAAVAATGTAPAVSLAALTQSANGPAASPAGTSLPAAQPATGQPATTTAAPGPGVFTIGPAVTDPVAFAPRPVVKVAIIGDSYTSGEGNNPATYTTNANGDIYPQHQSNMSPAMQALQQIVNANPGIDFQITNVAVSGATRAAALSPSEPGTPFLQPAQIDAVQNADLVINGFGGNDAGFPQWARTLLSPGTSDSSIPALWYGNPANPSAPNFSQYFTSGANYNDQLSLLSAIEPSLKPGAVVITNGYPQVFGDSPPAWDPSSPWTTSLGQNAVTYSNLFAQSLNKDNSAASAVAGYQNPMITNYFGDLQSALDGGQIGSATPMVHYIVPTWTGIDQSSLHPNPLGQTAAGSALQPVVNQAVQDIGASNGFTVNPGQPVMDTFAYEWNNRVSVPLQVQANQDYQQQVQPIAGQLQQTQGLLQLAQQAQQGPQFTYLGVPANQWTALSTLYPQPVNLPDGWTAPAPSTPTAFPALPADSGTPAAPGAATGPGSTSGRREYDRRDR